MDKIAIELSKLPFIETINSLKQEIDNYKPISKEIEDKVFQKLKLDWNYNSNAIEGNKLNYGETVAFLMHGITAKGKTLKDHLDIKGHNEAINFLLSLVKEDRDISEFDIRALHTMILVEEYDSDAKTPDGKLTTKRIKLGTYKTTPNSVETRTGEMHYYASPEETPALMKDLMSWYTENKNNAEIHPIVLASLFHFKFVAIHPFDDGNGRLARILINLILMRNNLPVVVVKNDDKANYYGVLAQADSNQFIPLVEYMSDLLQRSLNLYLKGVKGESIEEESDIDKEIMLFKKELLTSGNLLLNKEITLKYNFYFILPFFIKIRDKINQFSDFYSKISSTVIYYSNIDKSKIDGTVGFQNDSIDYAINLLNAVKMNKSNIDLSDYKLIELRLNFSEKKISNVKKEASVFITLYFTDENFIIDFWDSKIDNNSFKFRNEINTDNINDMVKKSIKLIMKLIKQQ